MIATHCWGCCIVGTLRRYHGCGLANDLHVVLVGTARDALRYQAMMCVVVRGQFVPCTRVQVDAARDALRYHAVGVRGRSFVDCIGLCCRRSGRFGEVCTRMLGWAFYAGDVLHLSAGSIRCSVVDVRTIVGLNRLGDVGFRPGWILVHLAHKMSSSGSSHSAQRHTYAGKTTEWFTCMGRSCSLFDERYVLVQCRGHCGSRAPGGAGNTRSFVFFCCFVFRGFAQSSVCVSLACSVFVGSRWVGRWD